MLEQLAVSFKVFGAEKFEKIKKQLREIKEKTSSPFETIAKVKVKGREKLDKLKEQINSIKAKVKAPFKMLLKTAGIQKALESTKIGFKKFGNYAVQQFEKAQKKANSLTGVIKKIVTALGAGLLIKTGIGGAGQLEQYRNTLETVLKDSKKAKQKLAWASRFSNKTPFETEEVVGGMTKLQSYGIEGDRVLKTTGRTYLEMIGDMASGMGKSFDQAIEAVADARTGELERLKEFGITKNMIAEFGKTQGIELFNSKGQIQDMELFNKALFEMMNSRFGGAMEKQAKTFKGGLSTIKGAFKSALSTLAGVNEFGDIVENSPFQILKDKVILPVANWLVKKQEDGTFTKWGEKLSETFSTVISTGEKIINFIVKWKELIIPLVSALGGLFILNKIVVLIGAIKVALAALSFNPIILGIGAAIAVGVLLYRNWDKIKEKMKQLWDKIKAFSKGLWEFGKKIFFTFTPLGILIRLGKSIIDNWDLIKAKFSEVGKYIYEKIQEIGTFFVGLKNKAVEVFHNLIDTLKGVWDTLKSTASSAFDFVLDYIEKIWEKIKSFFSNLGSKIKSLPGISLFFEEENSNEKNIDGSHKLGLSRVPFDGYIAELHEGERVLTKEENKNYSNTQTLENSSTKSNRKYELHFHFQNATPQMDWDKIAEMIVEKIEEKEMEREIAGGGI